MQLTKRSESKTRKFMQISILIYSFGFNDKGSNYLFENLANEILNRKMKSFVPYEFKNSNGLKTRF